MSDNLSIKITKAGKEAAFNVSNTGLELEISHVAFGDIGWTPVNEDEATALKNEILRVPIAMGEKIGTSQIRLTSIADGNDNFTIREVGFFLSDGTLFGVYSSEIQALAYKTAGTELVLAFDLILTILPPDSVSVVIEEGNNTNPSFLNELILVTLGNIKIAITQLSGLTRYLTKII